MLLPCDVMQVCGVFSIGWSGVSGGGGGGSLGPGWTVLVVGRSVC